MVRKQNKFRNLFYFAKYRSIKSNEKNLLLNNIRNLFQIHDVYKQKLYTNYLINVIDGTKFDTSRHSLYDMIVSTIFIFCQKSRAMVSIFIYNVIRIIWISAPHLICLYLAHLKILCDIAWYMWNKLEVQKVRLQHQFNDCILGYQCAMCHLGEDFKLPCAHRFKLG